MKFTGKFSALRPPSARATIIGLSTAVVLAATCGIGFGSGMYLAPSNSPGGVPAQSTITSVTTSGTNSTICWYGMQGWYTVEMSTNAGNSWLPVGRTVASEHAASLTVDNGGNDSAIFRLNQNNAYAGQGSCSGCHGDKFNQWSGTAHADALNSLTKIGQGNNPSCLPCHTVGFGQPTGYTDLLTTPHLKDVGCETCHGPSAWHKYSDHDIVHPAVSLDPKICGGCHQGSHHPTYEEFKESPHAQVNDDIKYGFSHGVYFTNKISLLNGLAVAPGTPGSSNSYGFYVTTNANLSLKTNFTTGIVHSGNGPDTPYVYDPGQDRAVGCGICHSAAARMAMLKDYEARLKGNTNAVEFPAAHESAEWSAACVTCHDPHQAENPAQLRNPTRSTQFYTMPTTADKRTIYTTNFMGVVTTNVEFYSAAFANMYDPNVQICAQCHNSRGARWDGRSYGYYNTNTLQSATMPGTGVAWGVQTNVSLTRGPHHSPQYNILIGIVQSDYLTTNSQGVATNFSSAHAGLSATSGNTNQCIACHVPNYSVDANNGVTGHRFELDTKGCALAGCHTGYSEDALEVKIEDRQTATRNSLSRIVDLLNQWALVRGPEVFGAVNAGKYLQNGWEYNTIGDLATVTNAGPSAADQNKLPDAIKQARFNIYMVANDGSLGVHNFSYVPFLLTDAENKIMSDFKIANFKAYATAGFVPLTVGFTNQSVGVTSYSWDFGDGNNSSAATPTNIYTTPGVYAVTLTATSASDSETVTRTNYIAVSERPAISFTASPRSGKTPLTVNFSNTSTSTNSVTLWRWTIDGKTIYDENPVYTFTNNLTTSVNYNIQLRAYTPGGSITVTSNAFITVTP